MARIKFRPRKCHLKIVDRYTRHVIVAIIGEACRTTIIDASTFVETTFAIAPFLIACVVDIAYEISLEKPVKGLIEREIKEKLEEMGE